MRLTPNLENMEYLDLDGLGMYGENLQNHWKKTIG